MPVIFVTVEEALGDLAKLKRGERAEASVILPASKPSRLARACAQWP